MDGLTVESSITKRLDAVLDASGLVIHSGNVKVPIEKVWACAFGVAKEVTC